MSVSKAIKPGKTISSRMQGARAVWVAVGFLALAFLVGVLAPAWYFAGRLVENNTAVRAIGELQQQPSRMQTALNSIQDRLRARGFVRDSIEQLKRATVQFDMSTSSLRTGSGVRIGGIGGDDDVQKTMWHAEAQQHLGRRVLISVKNAPEPIAGSLAQIAEDGVLLEQDDQRVAVSYLRITNIEADRSEG